MRRALLRPPDGGLSLVQRSVLSGKDSAAAGESGHGRTRDYLESAQQRQDPSDLEESLLRGRLCLRSHGGANGGEEGRAKQVARYRKPQQEWKLLLPEHHEGYICWEEYLENQQRLQANVIQSKGETGGAAKRGGALLSGCCVAEDALESCKSPTAAMAVVYRATSVAAIVEDAARVAV